MSNNNPPDRNKKIPVVKRVKFVFGSRRQNKNTICTRSSLKQKETPLEIEEHQTPAISGPTKKKNDVRKTKGKRSPPKKEKTSSKKKSERRKSTTTENDDSQSRVKVDNEDTELKEIKPSGEANPSREINPSDQMLEFEEIPQLEFEDDAFAYLERGF